jgi:hypothetical protein
MLQIASVRDATELQHNILLSINALTRALEFPASRVSSAFEHGLNLPGHRRKREALDQDREQQILNWMAHNAKSNTPAHRKEIKDYCISQFQAPITRGWINSFVLPSPEDVIQTKSAA